MTSAWGPGWLQAAVKELRFLRQAHRRFRSLLFPTRLPLREVKDAPEEEVEGEEEEDAAAEVGGEGSTSRSPGRMTACSRTALSVIGGVGEELIQAAS
jgi:hypothetical protein